MQIPPPQYHNDGYEITIDNTGTYRKTPPPTADHTQTPTPMPLKTRNLNDLRDAHARATKHERATEHGRAS